MKAAPAPDVRLRRTLNIGSPSAHPRDSQRARLYTAERAAFGYSPPLLSLREMEALVSRVLRSSWWKARWPEATAIRVKDGRARSVSAGGHRDPTLGNGSFITVPRHMRHRWVVCHELAHVVTPNRFAAHGREFAANYLDIVRYALGREAKARLVAEFKEHRVRHRAPVRTLEDLVRDHQSRLDLGNVLLQSTPSCGRVAG